MQHCAAPSVRYAPCPPAGPPAGRARRPAALLQSAAHPAQAPAAGHDDTSGLAGGNQPLGGIIAAWGGPVPPA
eukprot:12217222-Alexandrium_andersonii.AAC.1